MGLSVQFDVEYLYHLNIEAHVLNILILYPSIVEGSKLFQALTSSSLLQKPCMI